jgi:crossover junction endodeoxyribonuclease RusA
MRQLINLILPYPPSANSIWRIAGKRIILSERGRLYHREVAMCVLNQLGTPETILGPISLDVLASAPDNRKRDLGNLGKITLDALTHAKVWKDDSQIQRECWEWGERSHSGSLQVMIKPYEPPS